MELEVQYDPSVDAAYIPLSPNPREGRALINIVIEDDRLRDEVILDFTESGELLGIEILSAKIVLNEALLRDAKE